MNRIHLLDGATGSELERRGVNIDLPLWSARALLSKENRAVLRTIHADYIRAGADVITANTFRTNIRTLRKEGLEEKARTLTAAAVEEVRRAIDEIRPTKTIKIAGSVAPVEDCYRPDLVPSMNELADEHRRFIDILYDAQVDIILIETMNSSSEALLALEYAKKTQLPVYISFVLRDAHQLFNGEEFSSVIRTLSTLKPDAMLVNCVPVEIVDPALSVLRGHFNGPIGAYANILSPNGIAFSPDEYANRVRQWIDLGATLVGGCCGTTPEYIAAIHRCLKNP